MHGIRGISPYGDLGVTVGRSFSTEMDYNSRGKMHFYSSERVYSGTQIQMVPWAYI